MHAWSAASRGVARHPVLTFMVISLGVGFVTAAIPQIVDSEILPFGLPLHGVGMSFGAGLAAFWSRLRCQAGPASQTSHAVVCGGGSRCAGT
jgi:hypothetical protein